MPGSGAGFGMPGPREGRAARRPRVRPGSTPRGHGDPHLLKHLRHSATLVCVVNALFEFGGGLGYIPDGVIRRWPLSRRGGRSFEGVGTTGADICLQQSQQRAEQHPSSLVQPGHSQRA